MEINLQVGMDNEVEMMTTEQTTALKVGSGSLKVYATPVMISLMERAASELADKHLPSELTSVGISMNVSHKAPTPTGMKVRARAKITAIDGRKITYEITAYDELDEIGSGIHERFIVDRQKFQTKADSKMNGH